MLLLTGIRPCDLLNLKAGDIDLKNLVIHLDISKTQRQIKYPLYDELLNFVNSNLSYIKEFDNNGFIFPGYNVNMLGLKFRRLKQRLGI
jgi:integrase